MTKNNFVAEVTFKTTSKVNAEGLLSNLRPIIFSSLCKNLTACITNRIKDRLEAEMQSSQPAYRPNRSTTDYVFTSKLIIVRTVTARNESAHLIMLDIRKAFHSINKLTQKSRFTKHSLD